ncbi:UNVERIFIED_CONTAM: hypothetical protein B566_EDAN018946, partial [Ephemera danica]
MAPTHQVIHIPVCLTTEIHNQCTPTQLDQHATCGKHVGQVDHSCATGKHTDLPAINVSSPTGMIPIDAIQKIVDEALSSHLQKFSQQNKILQEILKQVNQNKDSFNDLKQQLSILIKSPKNTPTNNGTVQTSPLLQTKHSNPPPTHSQSTTAPSQPRRKTLLPTPNLPLSPTWPPLPTAPSLAGQEKPPPTANKLLPPVQLHTKPPVQPQNFVNKKDTYQSRLGQQNINSKVTTADIMNENVKEMQGDLFNCPEDTSLAHCVARDFKMSSGIAVDFNLVFGNADKLPNKKDTYQSRLGQQNINSKVTTADIMNENVKEMQGDLFNCPEDTSLAHCVARDFKMSSGIAVDFNLVFGNADKLRNENHSVGETAFLKTNRRYVFYLISKEKSSYYCKPTLETLQLCLENLRDICKTLGVKKLAMPRIGAGLDLLPWDAVLNLIKTTFKNTNIEITIFHLTPVQARVAQEKRKKFYTEQQQKQKCTSTSKENITPLPTPHSPVTAKMRFEYEPPTPKNNMITPNQSTLLQNKMQPTTLEHENPKNTIHDTKNQIVSRDPPPECITAPPVNTQITDFDVHHMNLSDSQTTVTTTPTTHHTECNTVIDLSTVDPREPHDPST